MAIRGEINIFVSYKKVFSLLLSYDFNFFNKLREKWASETNRSKGSLRNYN